MIEHLDGIHEVVDFIDETHLRLYDNDACENYPSHWHRPIEIIMPIENGYKAIVGGDVYEVGPREILLICPGVLHTLESPPTGRRLIFQADLSIINEISGLSAIISFLNPCAVFTAKNAPAIHRELASIMDHIAAEYFQSIDLNAARGVLPSREAGTISDNNMCELAIYSSLIRMITLIGRHHISNIQTESRNRTKQQEYISKFMSICAYIDSHFSEELTLEEVAAMSNFSKYHFSRLFREFTNMSFYKYVNRKRISCAEQLLTDPNLSATEVAIRSGFSSQSAFIRMFKQFNNCTPSEFRKMQQMHEF